MSEITVTPSALAGLECRELPTITHGFDAGDLGHVELDIDLYDYEDEFVTRAICKSVEVTVEEVVRAFRSEHELEALFSELVRQCGAGEIEKAVKATLS
jgi:hypothetical protein